MPGSSKCPSRFLARSRTAQRTAQRTSYSLGQPTRETRRRCCSLPKRPPVHILEVLEKGYSTDLTDVQLQVIGQDPFLIAHALTDVAGRCVVTNEGSAPRAKVEKRKIPDACNSVGVKYCTPFQMMSALGFKTSWTP